MANRLWVKSLSSVGAVDAGDNPEAKLMFWKRKDREPLGGVESSREGSMAEEFTLASLELGEEQAAALDMYIADRVAKAVEEASASPVVEEPEAGDVLKGLPEDQAAAVEELRKRAEETEQALAAEVEKREIVEWVRKAEPFADLIGAPEETGPVLRDLHAAAPEATETLIGWLKVISDRADLSELFKAAGTNELGDVESRRDAFVKAYLADHVKATVFEARAEFWKQHPDMVEASREGAN